MIVTADDVGLHPGITEGALAAHRDGVVTACSVVANGADFERAAELLRATPTLDAGVHLALVGARPLSPPEAVRSLVAGDGALLADHRVFLVRYLARRVEPADVARELRAQIVRVLEAGLVPSHLNAHQHLHVLPGVLEVAIGLAREFGIRYVRAPREVGVALSPRGIQVAALGRLAARAAARLRAAGLRTNDRAIGITAAGHLRADVLARTIDSARGVSEVVTHPGVGGREIARAYRWGYAWDAEREALCAPAVRDAIARAGTYLVGPRALP